MSLGVACLLSDDAREALAWARRLDALNRERRAIETEMRADATVQVDAMLALEGELPAAVCLRHDDWHPGVVGIVAARVKEQVARPVIAFAPDGPDRLKGSARTVPGVHVRDLIAQVAASHPDLVERFGGHAAAAGLSIPAAAYDAFARALSSAAERTIPAGAGAGVVWSDGELAPDEIDLTVAQMLRDAGPWGAGFPEPVFDGVFEVVGQRVVGKRHLKLSLAIPGSGLPVDGIYFNPDPAVVALDPVPRLEQVRLAYRLDVNAYRGTRRVQLVIEHLTPDV